METKKLTHYSRGSGCGCKIAPADLQRILAESGTNQFFESLLIDGSTNDDAAVVSIDGESAIISTTDFFTPVVDSAYDFGRIAAANALSDVYAMGGRPIVAIAILGWPVEQLGTDMAAEVIRGGRDVCADAGIALAGGHSITTPEPFFGLAVTGHAALRNIKRNCTAKPGDILCLTKPIGTGIISAALKRNLAGPDLENAAIESMGILNRAGEKFGELDEVHAMTDITGFGLVGHLSEMCIGSGVAAILEWDAIPLLLSDKLQPLIEQMVMPDNTMRNFKAYHGHCSKLSARQIQILCDPQTNGGLLVSASPDGIDTIRNICLENGSQFHVIGSMRAPTASGTITIV